MERVVILQALVLFLIFVVFWGLSGKAFLFYGKKCIAQAERGGSAEKAQGGCASGGFSFPPLWLPW